MASFTDTQPPKFNPYIQQQPVEAMVAVGTQKQKAHDEGVQKIQTQIDNLASIDVGRDVDKAYLQSKINEMGNSLRSVAGGDFGNFQLVNSVGGMIKQIGYDPYIRTAVASTANDRKQTELMEEDRKAGKLTPHAELYYNLKRQKYYNNNALKGEGGKPIGFGGKYVQSWDIDKALTEAIKAVGDSKWSADNVYKMIDGRIQHDKNGVPILSDFAIREKREGRFSEDVAAAIDGVLDRPEARQELGMRGVYNYQGYDDINDFINKYEKEKNAAITKLEGRKIEIMEKAASSTDKNEKAAYQKLIDEVDARIEKTKKDTELKESDAKQFSTVEGYKAALETQRVRNNYMQSGVTEEYSTEIIENIPWKSQRQVLKEERDFAMQKDASARGWASVDIQRQNAATSAYLAQIKGEEWAYDPKNPKNKLGASQAVLPQGNVYEAVYGNFNDANNAAAADVKKSQFDLVSEYMAAINYGNGKKLSKEEIEKGIKNFEKKSPGFIDRMYERARNVAKDEKLSVNPLYSKVMSHITKDNIALMNQDDLAMTTRNMNNSAGVRAAGGAEVDVAAIEKNYKPFEVEYVTDFDAGQWTWRAKTTKKTVTAQDAVDLAIIEKNVGGLKGLYKSITNSDLEKQQYEAAEQRIQTKYGTSGKNILKKMEGSAGFFGQFTGAPRKTFMPEPFKKVVNTVNSQKFDAVMKAKEEYLRNSGWSPQPVAYSVYDKDMKGPERESIDDRVKEVLNKHVATGAVDKFSKLYTNPKEYSAQIAIDRGSPYNPQEKWKLNLFSGGAMVESLDISRTDAEYIKQYNINLPPVASKTAQRLQAGRGTTNSIGLPPNHPDAYKGALISGDYYKKTVNSNRALGAEVVENPNGGYNAYVYTVDPKTNQTVGVPLKRNKGDYEPLNFPTGDDATRFLTEAIESKAFLDNVINNGL